MIRWILCLELMPTTSWLLPDGVLCPLKQTSNRLWRFQEFLSTEKKMFNSCFFFLHNSCLTHLSESFLLIHFYSFIVQRCNFLYTLFRAWFVQIDFWAFAFVFKSSSASGGKRIYQNHYSKPLMEINQFFC